MSDGGASTWSAASVGSCGFYKPFDSLLSILSEIQTHGDLCPCSPPTCTSPDPDCCELSPRPSIVKREPSVGLAGWIGGWGGMMLMVEVNRNLEERRTERQVRPPLHASLRLGASSVPRLPNCPHALPASPRAWQSPQLSVVDDLGPSCGAEETRKGFEKHAGLGY